MNWTAQVLEWLLPAGTTLLVAAVLFWSLRRAIPDEPATRIIRQLTSLVVVAIAIVALILALPLESTTTGQLLSLFGLVVTAVIALSSTTFVSNAMAGLMLRYVGGFYPGDFIRVGEQFGRVTEKGLLHTEIQSEDRDLITLPNLFIMNQPVRVVRSSGTLISADVSLGYDVPRYRVRDRLKEAAVDAELADPFVQITNLGDFSVSYRIYGFLEDVSNLVTKRNELRGKMLDRLHDDGIEIVSPSFMNQRQLDPARRMIPVSPREQAVDEDTHAEQMMFDKAEIAARVNRLRVKRDELKAEIEALDASDESQLERERSWRERQIGYLQDMIDTMEQR